MTPLELLEDLGARGISVRVDDDALEVGPEERLRPGDLDALRALKPAILVQLRGPRANSPASIGAVSLWHLDVIIEFTVPWWHETLFIAPGLGDVRRLEAEGISRGRIWRAAEILDMMLTDATPADARAVAEAKLVFGGAIIQARIPARPPS